MFKKVLSWFLPFERYTLSSKLPKDKLLKEVKSEISFQREDILGEVFENFFYIGIRCYKLKFGYAKNSFAPIADVKINEQENTTNLSVTIRMRLFACIVFYPLYFLSLICFIGAIIALAVFLVGTIIGVETIQIDYSAISFILFPVFQLVAYFAFKRPAKKLKHLIDSIALKDEIK